MNEYISYMRALLHLALENLIFVKYHHNLGTEFNSLLPYNHQSFYFSLLYTVPVVLTKVCKIKYSLWYLFYSMYICHRDEAVTALASMAAMFPSIVKDTALPMIVSQLNQGESDHKDKIILFVPTAEKHR